MKVLLELIPNASWKRRSLVAKHKWSPSMSWQILTLAMASISRAPLWNSIMSSSMHCKRTCWCCCQQEWLLTTVTLLSCAIEVLAVCTVDSFSSSKSGWLESSLESKDFVHGTVEKQLGPLGSLTFLGRVQKKSIFTVTHSNIKKYQKKRPW